MISPELVGGVIMASYMLVFLGWLFQTELEELFRDDAPTERPSRHHWTEAVPDSARESLTASDRWWLERQWNASEGWKP